MNTQPDVYLFGQVLGTHSFLLTGDFLQPDEYAEIKARFRARMRGFCPRRSNGCLKANMACLTTALMIISMTEPMAMRLRCARN